MKINDKGDNILITFNWLINFFKNSFLYLFKFCYNMIYFFFTGKSELERILLDGNCSTKMIIEMRNVLLNNSKYKNQILLLKRPERLPIEGLCDSLINLDKIKSNKAKSNLRECLLSLENTNIGLELLYKEKKIEYNNNNKDHEKLLMTLWNTLSTVPLDNRISEEWKRIGFQGTDPASDFRGMGLLGLENLCHFAKHETNNAKDMVEYGYNAIGYPFAITGINITSLLLDLMKDRMCDHIFITIPQEDKEIPSIYYNKFNDLYGRAYIKFHQYYVDSEKETLFDFPRIFGEFEEIIRKDLYLGHF